MKCATGTADPGTHGATSRPVYLSDLVNLAQAAAGMLSVAPSRSVVSRTSTSPASATPASTQSVPLPPL